MDGEENPVTEFKGFENPSDAENLKNIVLPGSLDKIADDALIHASNLESIRQNDAGNTLRWPKLPPLLRNGMHGRWKAGDQYVHEGDLMDPANSHAEPEWSKHELQHNPGTPSTCIEHGKAEYWYCPECGNRFLAEDASVVSLVKDEGDLILPLAAHKLSHKNGIAATCLVDGRAGYWLCLDCNRMFLDEAGAIEVQNQDDLKIPALGHSMVHVEAKRATCTEDGYEAHYKCSRCNQLSTDAAGMNVVVFSDLVIEKKNHRYEDGTSAVIHKPRIDATCEKPGMHEYWYCDICQHKYTDESMTSYYDDESVMIPAMGHEYGSEWVSNEAEHWHECLNDHSHIKDKGIHSWSEYEIIQQPTYDENGYKEKHCTVCGRIEKAYIPAIDHKYTIETVVKPTCKYPGYTRLDCSLHDDCGKYIIKEGSWVPALNHKNKQHHDAVLPTCTEKGRAEYWYCPDCQKNYSDEACKDVVDDLDSLDIDALGHSWSKEWSSNENEHWRDCSRCEERTDVASHEYEKIRKPEYIISSANCKECAVYKMACICGHPHPSKTWVDEEGGLGRHILKAVAKNDSTCTEIGHEAHYECNVCGLLFRDESGMEVVTLKELEIPLKAHELEFVDGVDPTCTTPGMKSHYKCSACGQVFEDKDGKKPVSESELMIQAKGHTFDGYSKFDENSHKKKCKVCGQLYGDPVQHSFVYVYNNKEHWQECSFCKYEKADSRKPHKLTFDSETGYDLCDCGYKVESAPVEGGIEIEFVDKDPRGELDVNKEGCTVSVAFVELRNKYRALDFEWRIDDIPMEEFDGLKSIEFEATENRNYQVMCIFKNNYGVSSRTIFVRGGIHR